MSGVPTKYDDYIIARLASGEGGKQNAANYIGHLMATGLISYNQASALANKFMVNSEFITGRDIAKERAIADASKNSKKQVAKDPYDEDIYTTGVNEDFETILKKTFTDSDLY